MVLVPPAILMIGPHPAGSERHPSPRGKSVADVGYKTSSPPARIGSGPMGGCVTRGHPFLLLILMKRCKKKIPLFAYAYTGNSCMSGHCRDIANFQMSNHPQKLGNHHDRCFEKPIGANNPLHRRA